MEINVYNIRLLRPEQWFYTLPDLGWGTWQFHCCGEWGKIMLQSHPGPAVNHVRVIKYQRVQKSSVALSSSAFIWPMRPGLGSKYIWDMFYLFDIAFLFLGLTTWVFNASCYYTEKRTNTEIREVLRAADDIMEMMTWVRPGKSSCST